MTGVAVEQMLELWCVELRQVKANLKSLFAHHGVAEQNRHERGWHDNAKRAGHCNGGKPAHGLNSMPYQLG
ncbi:hypothetical protein [Microvirga sp. 2TAF3]|uniref:hypothetical protein n=1 Tax=Microvirga sp. 2TAF3 TaxID=3233014 RepID=UPI003F99E5C9